jgi:quercetin dioxygenase-like cupin family protein
MNHFPAITKIFSKDVIFSTSCKIQNFSEDGGVEHVAVPVHLNANTIFFVSGKAGVLTKEHTHHHPHWMVVQDGEIEFVHKGETHRLSEGQWVYVPSEVTHQIRYLSAAKVICMHHVC